MNILTILLHYRLEGTRLTQEQELLKDTLSWQRRILNGYWIVLLLSFIAECVAFYIKIKLNADNIQSFLLNTMAIPTGIQLFIVIINELLERYYKKPRPYTIILSGIFIGAVLIYGNQSVIGIQYVMMIPMLVAAFQFNKKHLTFTFLVVFPVLGLMYMLYPLIWSNMTIFERFALFYILTGEYLILLQLLHRSNELLNRLIKTSRSEQDLLIKHTIMERLSKTDALTDLYNHRTFQEYLDNMIEHCESSKMPLQIAIIDIDNFKSVNDTYGHAIGDIILKRVAGVLQQSLTSDEIIARYGGEEFAVLFPAKTLEQSFQLCEQLRRSIWQLSHPEMQDRKITVSIGLNEYACGIGKSRFFSDADALLYEAKRSGKNKTVYIR